MLASGVALLPTTRSRYSAQTALRLTAEQWIVVRELILINLGGDLQINGR